MHRTILIAAIGFMVWGVFAWPKMNGTLILAATLFAWGALVAYIEVYERRVGIIVEGYHVGS